ETTPHGRSQLFEALVCLTSTPPWCSPRPVATFRRLLEPTGLLVDSMLFQLADSLSQVHPRHLRSTIGEIPWVTRFVGSAYSGAIGLPGTYRQSLAEIATELRIDALSVLDSTQRDA